MNRRLCTLWISASFLLLFLLLANSAPAAAQAITATLEGRVTDSSGGVIPGATVTAINVSTKISRSAQASELGDYRIPLLPTGDYDVSVEQQGFQKETKRIRLLVGQVATLDFALQVGTLAQEVVVEAGAAVLERTRTEVSSVIVEQQIDTLPVNGRQFIDFALLAPGVTVGETTSGSTDVIVEPAVEDYEWDAFDRAEEIIAAGAASMRRALPRLRMLLERPDEASRRRNIAVPLPRPAALSPNSAD